MRRLSIDSVKATMSDTYNRQHICFSFHIELNSSVNAVQVIKEIVKLLASPWLQVLSYI